MTKNNGLLTIKVANATLMVFFFLFTNCNNSKSILNKVKLVYNIPVVKLSGELINLTDSLYIITTNKYIIYKLPYTYTVENDSVLLIKEVRYNFFGYRLKSKTGHFFSNNADTSSILSVDSVLTERAFLGFKFFDSLNDSLVGTQTLPQRQPGFMEKYIPKIKYDDTYPDTTYLYFSDNFKNTVYTFSDSLDILKKSKIYKVTMRTGSHMSLKYNIMLPEQEYRFELKNADNINLKEITKILDYLNKVHE